MPLAHAASLADLLQGLHLAGTGPGSGNHVRLAGLSAAPQADGSLEFRLDTLEAAALRIASGPMVLEIGSATLRGLAGQVRIEGGRPRLAAATAASAELSGVTLEGPAILPVTPAAAGPWNLAPLAAANGTIRAEIVDAHLLFDADVTVPIHDGQVDFNAATVEHVGPDSRMGVSRMGLYVDAPNGRSYLYQFPATPVAGVEFEQRSALPGPWAASRGKLQLQPFAEGLLRQQQAGHKGPGFTGQSRLLFDRTAVSGEVRLGDGPFAAPGVQARLAGRAAGSNAMRIQSQAVGRGLALDIASLAVQQAALAIGDARLACDTVSGALALRLAVEEGQVRFAIDLPELALAGLRLQRPAPSA